MSRHHQFLGALAAVLSISVAPQIWGAESCLPLLSVTGHDATWVTYRDSIQKTAKLAFCDKRFLKRDRDSSFGSNMVIPIDGVPFNFGIDSTSKEALEARRMFCHDDEKTFTQNVALDITRKIVSRDSLRAYVECRKINVSFDNSISLSAKELGSSYVVASASFARKYPNQPYPHVTSVHTKNLKCDGVISSGTELTETPKKDLCERSGDKVAILMIQTKYETASVTLPRRGKAGRCSLFQSIPKTTYVDSGECRSGTALTDQLNNEPERPYNIVVSANFPDEKIGPECQKLFCRPRPGFTNGCAFGRQVDQNISEKQAITYLMVGSHPQMWTRGFKILKRKTSYKEQEVAGSNFDIFFGKSFAVDVPDGIGITVKCSIGENEISLNPLSMQPELESYLTQMGPPVRNQGRWTVNFFVKPLR